MSIDLPMLHQQAGGMSLQAFADQEGLTLAQVNRLAKLGRILGARQDARSKRWWIYPPAKLLEAPRSVSNRSVAGMAADRAGLEPECDTPRAARSSRAGVMAAGHADTHPAQVVNEAADPLNTDQQAPQGRAAGFPSAYRRPEVQRALQVIREAVAKHHREGIHYLRLDAAEFSHLYAALGRERSRLRKLVSRGLAAVGELSAHSTRFGHRFQQHPATNSTAFGRVSRSEATQVRR